MNDMIEANVGPKGRITFQMSPMLTKGSPFQKNQNQLILSVRALIKGHIFMMIGLSFNLENLNNIDTETIEILFK